MAGTLFEVFVIKVVDPDDGSVRYVQDFNSENKLGHVSFIEIKDFAKGYLRLSKAEEALDIVKTLAPKYKYSIDYYMGEFDIKSYEN